jgi:hypothetical protein
MEGRTSQDNAATAPALAPDDEKTPPPPLSAWMVRRDKICRAKQQLKTAIATSNTSSATTIKCNSSSKNSSSGVRIVGCDVISNRSSPSNDNDTKKSNHKVVPSDDMIIVQAHLLRSDHASHTKDHNGADGSKHNIRCSRSASVIVGGGNWWDVPVVPLERPVGDVFFVGNRLQ